MDKRFPPLAGEANRALRILPERDHRPARLARRKRRLTSAMMAERTGVAPATYRRVERGDTTVCFGAYAMVLFVLGFHGSLRDLADARRGEIGLQLDAERLPQRVRVRKTPTSR